MIDPLNNFAVVILAVLAVILVAVIAGNVASVRKARHLAKFASERPDLAREIFGIEKIQASANDVRK